MVLWVGLWTSCEAVGRDCALCGGVRLGMRFVRRCSAGNALRAGCQRSRNANPTKTRRTKRKSDRGARTKRKSGRGARTKRKSDRSTKARGAQGQEIIGKAVKAAGRRGQDKQPADSEPAFIPMIRTLLRNISGRDLAFLEIDVGVAGFPVICVRVARTATRTSIRRNAATPTSNPWNAPRQRQIHGMSAGSDG